MAETAWSLPYEPPDCQIGGSIGWLAALSDRLLAVTPYEVVVIGLVAIIAPWRLRSLLAWDE